MNRQTPCGQPGTSSLQWKRPRSSPAMIQCMKRTSEKTFQHERRLLAARPHAFAQEVGVERRERNDHDDGEDCEIGPKARDGDRAGRCEQCGGRGDHEQACLEVSRDGHPLLYEAGVTCCSLSGIMQGNSDRLCRKPTPMHETKYEKCQKANSCTTAKPSLNHLGRARRNNN